MDSLGLTEEERDAFNMTKEEEESIGDVTCEEEEEEEDESGSGIDVNFKMRKIKY